GGMVPRLKVVSGQVITLGDTEITLTHVATPASDIDPVLERGGALMFNRSPRVEVRYPGTQYPYPKVPTEAQPKIFPWPMVVAPIMLGLAMFAMTQRPSSLLMIFMSPMMMLGNVISQKTQSGQKLKREIDTYEVQIEELEDELAAQTSIEQERRRAEAPAVAHVYEQAMQLGSLLWTRRPEHWNFLSLRLGVGRALSRNEIAEPNNPDGIPKYARQIEKLQERHKWVDDVPLVETFPSA